MVSRSQKSDFFERRHLYWLLAILSVVTLSVSSITFFMLYNAAFEESRQHLESQNRALGSLIVSVAKFDSQYSTSDHPKGSISATLSQVEAALGMLAKDQTPEQYYLAKLEGGKIHYFLLKTASVETEAVGSLMAEKADQAMQLALQKQEGSIISMDTEGHKVLAAYRWLDVLGMGLVTSLHLNHIREPFVTTGVYVLVIAGLLVFSGSLLIFWITRNASAQIRENEEKYRNIFDSAVDGIVTIDKKGTIQSINPTVITMFGYQASELIGQNVNILMPSPFHEEHDGYLANYQRTRERKIIGIGREVKGLRKDGSTFPLDLAVSETKTRHGVMFTGQMRDISDRKEVDRIKAEFVSTVSHELRTPLTSILGTLGLIKGGVAGEINPEAEELVTVAHQNSQRLLQLVNDILDIEKIAAGKMELHLEMIDLRELIHQAAGENEGFASAYGVHLNLEDIPKGLLAKIDSGRITQVMFNLISNAIKFSPKDAAIVISARTKNGNIEISVKDEGPGIPKAFQAQLFEKFTQADSTATRKVGGTGLGLSIVKALVELHGGEVGFETKEGQGSTFFFLLPKA